MEKIDNHGTLQPVCCLDGRVLAAFCTRRKEKFGNTPSGMLVVVITEKICSHMEWYKIVHSSCTWEEAADAAIGRFGGFSMLLPKGEQYEMTHLGAILQSSLYEEGLPEA